MTDPYSGPLPVPTPETRPYWEAAKQHRLSLPYCSDCSSMFFYPRPFCPRCLGDRVEWRDASGRAVLLSFVIVHRAPRKLPLQTPYVLGLVELEEGPRLMARVVGIEPDPQQVRCDLPLEVAFEDLTDQVTLPVFRPRAPGGAA